MRKRKRMERRPVGERITIIIRRGRKRVPVEVELISPVVSYDKDYDPVLVTVRSDEGTVFRCGRKAIIR